MADGTSTREPAAHTCPVFKVIDPTITGTARDRSASGSTICGALPPSSTCSGMRFRAQAAMIAEPVSGEPVNDIRRTSGCSGSAAPASVPYPVTTFTTPGGIPASSASLASSRQVSGASSAGLTTMVLPTAMAGATSVTMIGPGTFHGMMLPHTPNGSRIVIPSTSGVAVGSVCPVILSASPAGNSITDGTGDGPQRGCPTSICSRISMSRTCSRHKAAQRRSRSARATGLVSRQPGNASKAARTAASMSAGPLRGTRSSTSPVAGLITSIVSPPAAGTHCPPISCAPSVSRELGSTTASGPANPIPAISPPPKLRGHDI